MQRAHPPPPHTYCPPLPSILLLFPFPLPVQQQQQQHNNQKPTKNTKVLSMTGTHDAAISTYLVACGPKCVQCSQCMHTHTCDCQWVGIARLCPRASFYCRYILCGFRDFFFGVTAPLSLCCSEPPTHTHHTHTLSLSPSSPTPTPTTTPHRHPHQQGRQRPGMAPRQQRVFCRARPADRHGPHGVCHGKGPRFPRVAVATEGMWYMFVWVFIHTRARDGCHGQRNAPARPVSQPSTHTP